MTRRGRLYQERSPASDPLEAVGSTSHPCFSLSSTPALNFLSPSWIWLGLSGDFSGMWRASGSCPSRPAGEAFRLCIDCVTDNNSVTHGAAAGLFLLSPGPSSLSLPSLQGHAFVCFSLEPSDLKLPRCFPLLGSTASIPTTVCVLNPVIDLRSHVEEGRRPDPAACRQGVCL